MGEDQPNNNAGRAVEWVTAREAAALLGVHYNTIRNRIKTGMYRAEKFQTEKGPTWMIERDSLIDNTPTSARQQAVSGVSAAQQEAIQELARAIVREAGVQSDPKREARLEGRKLEVEALKTQVLISSGLLVGLTAVVGFLSKATFMWLLFLALSFVLASVVFGIMEIQAIALKVRYQQGPKRQWPFRPVRAPLTYLVAGLVVFLVFLSYNIPGAAPENTWSSAARVVVAAGIVLLLLVTGAIGKSIVGWWQDRSAPDEP